MDPQFRTLSRDPSQPTYLGPEGRKCGQAAVGVSRGCRLRCAVPGRGNGACTPRKPSSGRTNRSDTDPEVVTVVTTPQTDPTNIQARLDPRIVERYLWGNRSVGTYPAPSPMYGAIALSRPSPVSRPRRRGRRVLCALWKVVVHVAVGEGACEGGLCVCWCERSPNV